MADRQTGSASEKRRFPRVTVRTRPPVAQDVLSARVIWPNWEISSLVDLSYKGLAARQPALFPVAVQARLEVGLGLGHMEEFKVSARLVWSTSELVGMELQSLSPEAQQQLARFLDAQLLGASLKPVQRLYHAPDQTFHYWFQGHQDTHVFIWVDEAHRIERIRMELDGQAYEFFRGRAPGLVDPRAWLVLAQMGREHLPVDEFFSSMSVSVSAAPREGSRS